ncbi:hypothetical protein FA95DRAFT_1589968 [Auriscalpium vulgare]|uniref:Uncharacterized protein n=1 Tax=Auriscalpium vulgare TaxID=40419 RepID=A0ACB8RLD1_9AGAM|nr:hypothetical protein FA95DRAFT_1589968 [Auriscalpium vulgare]
MRGISPRDAVLILTGAACMHVFSFFFHGPTPILVETRLTPPNALDLPLPDPHTQDREPERQAALDYPPALAIPHTTLVKHAPGWTIFQDVYMANGTLFIVTPDPQSFPDIALMTSTGLYAFNTPENIAARMPSEKDISFITPEEAHKLWGGNEARGEIDRVFTVEGSTILVNDPDQFLDHYYHFCAELLFGAFAMWRGTFTAKKTDLAPPITRMIFTHSTAEGWRDLPGMNTFFMRAAFPSVTTEVQADWEDRIIATATRRRAWRFPMLLLADRSAAFRGEECGSRTQRIAAEAIKAVGYMSESGRGWWEPVRRAVLQFAGVGEGVLHLGDRAFERIGRTDLAFGEAGGVEDVVVTYITRQGVRRHLIAEDHERLVDALEELCARRGWELNVVPMERLSKEEQLSLVARTTFLVGVHGNGLTHLIMMPITPISTVIELFYPTGFAHDYEWTARALGMRHFGVWNDTSTTYPDVQWPSYPEGFQGTEIPVYGPYVARIIEDRADGRLP